MKSILKLIALSMLSITILLNIASCGKQENNSSNEESKIHTTTSSSKDENLSKLWSTAKYTTNTQLGNGEKKLEVEVKAEDKSVLFTIHTNKGTLADALTELELISGDDSEYGLYIKQVNGITADFDINKSYWSISKDGSPLAQGADSVKITDGEHYEFTYIKE